MDVSSSRPAHADMIRLEGLELQAEIGVYGHEREIRQRLVIDLALETSIAEAAATDALAHATDYDRAAAIARDVAQAGHHALIETVAEEIAQGVLRDLPRVERVFVRVAKPAAIPDARTVAIEIWRGRAR